MVCLRSVGGRSHGPRNARPRRALPVVLGCLQMIRFPGLLFGERYAPPFNGGKVVARIGGNDARQSAAGADGEGGRARLGDDSISSIATAGPEVAYRFSQFGRRILDLAQDLWFAFLAAANAVCSASGLPNFDTTTGISLRVFRYDLEPESDSWAGAHRGR
jgi:hypothetical protein